MNMKSLRYLGAICLALAIGFSVGRFSNPLSAKASGVQGFTYVVRVASPTVGSPASVPTLYGSPISISCSGDSCYILTAQHID
jgi:hypothetical protein